MGYRLNELGRAKKSRVAVFCAWTICITVVTTAVSSQVAMCLLPATSPVTEAVNVGVVYSFAVGVGAWLVYLWCFINERWLEQGADHQCKWWVVALSPIALFGLMLLLAGVFVWLGPHGQAS